MAFNSSLSGMRAANADLNVTSHNIANVNTTGFKESRAEFAEVFSSTGYGLLRNGIGAGVRLTRVIGGPSLPDLDPFLLLDLMRLVGASRALQRSEAHPTVEQMLMMLGLEVITARYRQIPALSTVHGKLDQEVVDAVGDWLGRSRVAAFIIKEWLAITGARLRSMACLSTVPSVGRPVTIQAQPAC